MTQYPIETPQERSERLKAEEREERLRVVGWAIMGLGIVMIWAGILWAILG